MAADFAPGKAINVAIVATPFASSTSIFSAYEDFHSVDGLKNAFEGKPQPNHRCFNVKIVGSSTDPVNSATDVPIQPHCRLQDFSDCHLVYLPAMMPVPHWMGPCEAGDGRAFPQEIVDWVKARYAAGAVVASLCNGSYVLAEAGLLSGKTATTHWAMAAHMQRCYPDIDVRGEESLIIDGADGRLVTGGTGSYHNNLVLYLVQRFLGRERAHDFARITGKFWAAGSQNMFARILANQPIEDALMCEAQDWLRRHVTEEDVVGRLAAAMDMAPRTLARRFKEATGLSPRTFAQKLRVEEARHLLECGDLPLQEVAWAVGYVDVSHFSRLFRREVGESPGGYRKKFRLPPKNLPALAEMAMN